MSFEGAQVRAIAVSQGVALGYRMTPRRSGAEEGAESLYRG
ncbi:MAG: hypothetical protein ACP5M0_08420 [Desulfomonilaceae bacterium]